MGTRYGENNSALMLLCALLIPVAVLSQNLITSGVAIIAFILIKITMLANFFSQDDFEFEHKTLLLAIITGLFFMLAMVIAGRSLTFEVLGLLLIIGYLVLALILVFSKPNPKKTSHVDIKESKMTEDEINEFRKLDETDALMTVQEIKKQKHLTDFEDFKRPKEQEWKQINIDQPQKYSKLSNDGYYEIKHEEDYNTDGYIELYPSQKQIMLDKKSEKTVQFSQEPKVQVVNIKEAQSNVMDDLHKLKSDIMQFDEGVKTIDEKIKLIAEKAILEGAQKKLQLLAQKEKDKQSRVIKSAEKELVSEKSILEDAQKELEALSRTHEKKTTSKKSNLHVQKNALEQLQKELELLERSQDQKQVKIPANIIAQKNAMEQLQSELNKINLERRRFPIKKLQILKKVQKTRVKRIDLYASNTGNKYHSNRSCLTLKKVNKKDILKFTSVEAARKKKLTACGFCKRK